SPAERLVLEGFLPSRPGPRAARLAALVREPRALVFFEAARRLAAFLAAAEAALGDREAAIARELTKRHEEILRGRLSALRERVGRRASLRGEVTVLVAGAPAAEPASDVASIDDELRAGRAAGRGLREPVALRVRTQAPDELEAVHRRHAEIAEDHVGARLAEPVHRLLPVLGRDDPRAEGLEQRPHGLAVVRDVVHHQDGRAFEHAAWS